MFAREMLSAKMICIIENIFEEGEWAILEWRDPHYRYQLNSSTKA